MGRALSYYSQKPPTQRTIFHSANTQCTHIDHKQMCLHAPLLTLSTCKHNNKYCYSYYKMRSKLAKLIQYWSRVVVFLLFALTLYLLETKSASFQRHDGMGSRLSTSSHHEYGSSELNGENIESLSSHQKKPTYRSYQPNHTSTFDYTDYESPEYVPYEYILYDGTFARPYEKRWPESKLPPFAKKIHISWEQVPKGKHVCFVSVGKTAGSSLSGLLGFKLNWPDKFHIPNGVLAHYTTHMFHGDVNNCADDTPYYLFTLRNPLQRVQSAYSYDRDQPRRPGNRERMYDECGFASLNQFAEQGLAANGNATDGCKQIAYEAIRGVGDIMYSYHLFANYNYYRRVAFSQARRKKRSKILVIRTEHMEMDWNSADRILGDEEEEEEEVKLKVPHLNTQTKASEDTYLSKKSQALLCDALCDEIQMYKRILHEAINLNSHDFAQSMAELEMSCPDQAKSYKCS